MGLLLIVAGGCTRDTSGGSGEGGPSRPDVVTPVLLAGVGETNAVGETLCSMRELGKDEYGRQFVDVEVYNFGKINEELARYPELAEGTGIREVRDCEGARAYAMKYMEFIMAHPNFRRGPSKEEMFAEMLKDPDFVGEPRPRGAGGRGGGSEE
ncbi:MAG: hypothetical protein DIU78_021960 [Pseudomonadota bacterium]